MIFGRPTLAWENAPPPEEYFKSIYGVDEVHTLDVSAYEGATFIHDLNDPELPPELIGRYRAVSWGGTVQLVFNVGTVLRKTAELLEVGGIVFCGAPSNNWQEASYYQLCPTLKFDFYEANGFELGTSMASFYAPKARSRRRYIPVYPGEADALNYVPARMSHLLVAKKVATSTCDKVPINSTYRFKHTNERVRWRFRAAAPYDVENGKRVAAPVRRFEMNAARFENIEGCWACPFFEKGLPASNPTRPFRSRALLYENGKLLTWIVSDKTMVAEKPGSFIHSDSAIYFTTSDGTSPVTNGRKYEVHFPQPFVGLDPYCKDGTYD